jgi:quercetin dioxygenase-like cupin family protein
MKAFVMAASVSLLVVSGGYAAGEDITASITSINGSTPPGLAADLVDTNFLLNMITPDGKQLIVHRGTRKAGTRAPIHMHNYGGHTCVLTGEITDFIEGREPKKYPAGTCYYMPPGLPMSADNLGSEDAVLIDTFIVPPGEPFITILEKYR